MNDDTTGACPQRHGDREEIARLLPAPADWDLPREQYLRHRDLLMHHIDHEQVARPRPARRLLRPAVLAPATALALACAVTAGIALTGGDSAPTGTASHRAATDMQPAAALLARISDATETRVGLTVRDDQFVYTRRRPAAPT